MSLYLLHLLGDIRDRLDDHGGDRETPSPGFPPPWQSDDRPCLWKNRELLGHLLETVKEIGARNPIADDRIKIATRGHARLYRLPDYVLAVNRARRDDGEPLLRASLAEMEHVDREYRIERGHLIDDGRRPDPDADWRMTLADEPTHYLLDERKGYLSLYPSPRNAGHVRLTVDRTYVLDDAALHWTNLQKEVCPVTELPDEFPDTELMRDALVAGVCARAYRKRDSDAQNRELAAECEAEFDARVGPRRSLKALHALAAWAGDVARLVPHTRFAR